MKHKIQIMARGLFFLTIFLMAFPANARERIRIVGSTAVYGFSTAVAERFDKMTGFKAPIIEATGTGGGINLFCGGVGDKYPDIVNTSRPMSKAEISICKKNNVKDIREIVIGHDGIVIGANIDDDMSDLSAQDLFIALSEKLIINGKVVNNPYTHWNQVNPSLPNKPIIVLGPTSSLATREVFEDIIIQCQCKKTMPSLFPMSIRTDGHFIEVSEHENVIVQRLNGNKNAVGIFSYSFLVQNQDRVKPIRLDGILPNKETIRNGTYPLSRMLYMYIKGEHVGKVAGLEEFAKMFKTKDAIGPNGHLVKKGLVTDK